MMKKSFKPAKCKTALKLLVARIKLLRNKREQQAKQMRREVALLLGNGQEQTALIRVEHVIREEKTISAYDLLELYCDLIVARLPVVESQKSCPVDLKEAISSVIFASPRCADLPELMDVRKHFASKYGKDFVNSALEVLPNCGVSRLVVEKLSAIAPAVETKLKVLTSIAEEHHVKWDSEAFREQHQKPHDDLLNGSNMFVSASKMPGESYIVKSASAPSQMDEPRVPLPWKDTTRRSTSFSPSFQTNNRTTDNTVPRSSDIRSEGAGANDSYSRGENAPFNRHNWNMDFQDATSAAQAAAESAEIASMAARAAADLASRGYMSRQNSDASNNESPSYNTQYDRPGKLWGLLGEDFVEESVTNYNNELKGSQEMKTEMLTPSESRKAPSRPSSRSSDAFVDEDNFDVNPFSHDSTNVIPLKVSSSHNANTFGDEKFREHQEDEGQTRRKNAEEGFSGSTSQKPSNSSDYNSVAFDDFGSDTENNHSLFGRNRGNLLDSFQEGKSSSFQSNISLPSASRSTRGSLLHSFKESSLDEHPDAKFANRSQSYGSSPAAFDDYGEKSIDSDEEVAHYIQGRRDDKVTTRSSKGYEENIQTGSYSADKLQRRSSSTSLHNSQPSPRSHKASTNSNDSNKKLEMPSMPLGAEDLEISDGFDNTRSRQGLNFGSLVGEFRHTGFPRPPYARSSSSDASCLSKQTSSRTSTRTYNNPDSKERSPTVDTGAYRERYVTQTDKVTPSYSNKTGAGLESRTINTYGHESQMKARKESSLRINNLDSDDNEVKLDSNYTAGNRGNEFSPRARDVPLQSRISNTKPHGLSNMTNTSRMEYKPSQASFPAPEPISGETRDAVNLQQGTYKHSHPFPSDEQPAVAPKRTLSDSGVQKSKEESKLPSPSGDSTSREGSFKRASHVHPKLPDYDTLAAHFRALRSNQR